ncbi:MAG TPA: PQQ-binding-like beta-propeller repeat protein [Paludibaculum sp.]
MSLLILGDSRLLAGDWPRYLLNNQHHSHAVEETAINKDSVSGLRPLWQTRLAASLAAAPIVVDGVIYVGAWDGTFFAIDALTGDVKWKTFVGVAPAGESDWCPAGLGVSASAAVHGDEVLVPGGDARLYGLDRETGRELWNVQVADPALGNYLWAPPVIQNDLAFIGLSSLGDCPMVRGGIARLDLRASRAPEPPLVTYLMPEYEVGGGVWTAPAIDEETGALFVTTGNTEDPPDAAAGRYGGGLLKLTPDGRSVEATFFIPTNVPGADLDWGSSPVLFAASDGAPLVGATGKDGVLYVHRRDDLSQVYTVRIAQSCICPECGCGSLSTPAYDGERLYVAGGVAPDEEDSYLGSAYALSPDNGEILWLRRLDGTVIAPPTVAGGVLFLPTTQGLEALDCATGETLWRAEKRELLYSQVAIANGVLYATWLDGTLAAYVPAPAQPASSAARHPPSL